MLSPVKFSFSFLTLYSLFFILKIEVIFTKIHFKNRDVLEKDNSYKVTRKSRVGAVFLSLLLASGLSAGYMEHVQQSARENQLNSMLSPTSCIEVSIDDLNDMNVILNDNDCSDTFFQDVLSQLREDGLSVTATHNGEDINQNDATVITLDQQYSAGEGTVIFAPYDNARAGHSDSLALSMRAAFLKDGFLADEISCSQTGYFVDSDGHVQYHVPTSTEKAIDQECDSSFVTISFGTKNQDAEKAAKSIESGLARQNYYLNEDDNQSDLIYRAHASDSLEGVAEYFGTDVSQLKQFNGMDASTFSESQAVIHPEVKNIPSFQIFSSFEVTDSKNKTY